MKCWNCKTENSEDAIYCQQCGKVLNPKVTGFWDTSLGEFIYKIAPGASANFITTQNLEPSKLEHSKTEFKLDWSVIAVATLIFIFFGIVLYDFEGHVLWIPGLIVGFYTGLKFKNKPNSTRNFIATFIISSMLSVLVLAVLGI